MNAHMPWDSAAPQVVASPEASPYPESISIEETLAPPAPVAVKQPTLHPVPKVGLGVGLGGGFLVALQAWLKQRFGIDLLDIEIALLVWIGSFVAAYQTKDRK